MEETKLENIIRRVALLAEGVDRNQKHQERLWQQGYVALLAEGVDRNSMKFIDINREFTSPSSRRAWIEMALRLK